MIYEIENNYIDLSQLQYISKIIEQFDEKKNRYYFRYTVGDFTWDSESLEYRTQTNDIRNALISAWKDHKDSR